MSLLSLYRLATGLLAPVVPMVLERRAKRGKEDRTRLSERYGEASLPRPQGKLIWIHGASVGESVAVLPLIERLRAAEPDISVLVTTGTVTSAQLMAQRLPEGAFHQFLPVDRIPYVRRFLDHWQPDAAIWVESEFWPNLVSETQRAGVPMALVNGRMSEKSFAGWSKRRRMIKSLLDCFQILLVQDQAEADRYSALGGKNVQPLGNLKFAAGPLPVEPEDIITYDHALTGRPRWLAASTFEGEELIAAGVHAALKPYYPDLLTLIVPRHPDRGPAIADAIRASYPDLELARRAAQEDLAPSTDVYLADTIGELGLFYRLSKLVFIGKSLTEQGGQNPLEPALLGCAIIHGPHMSNFVAITNDMTAHNISLTVQDADELRDAVASLMAAPGDRNHRGEAARDYAESKARVLDDTLAALRPLLDQVNHARP